jgi:hypothetical protein
MKRLLLLAAVLFAVQAEAQTDIFDARNNFTVGQTVTVSGVVTNGDELGVIRYIEDGTAGIACYPGSGSVSFTPLRGDSITLTGELKDYNGLLEIDPITNVTIHTTGNPEPTPMVITPIQSNEANEGRLINVQDAVFSAGGGTFASGTYNFTSNSEQGVVYVNGSSQFIGRLVPVGPVNLVGINSQFTFSVPANDGYQILPRDTFDLVSTSPINFATGVTQDNITTTSFDLHWDTDVASSSNVRYGLTPSLELGDINAGGNTTTHTVSLPGLTPATFYHVMAYSVTGTDTAFSGVNLYSTASTSTGEILAYFNKPVNNSYSTGTNAIQLLNTFNDTIKAYIDRAQTTLDIAVYNTSDATIVNAVNDAYTRGVDVRWITEGGNANLGLSSLDPAITVWERQNATSSGMHNKFVVIDADDANGSFIIAGSTNWTNQNLFDDYNNLIIIQDQAVAKAYELEFEEMWGSSTMTPNGSNSKFGADKLDNTPHLFMVDGKEVEVYFSPSDGTTAQIESKIESVDYSMEFALLAFTRDDLGLAVIDADNRFGVVVKGIIEQTSGTGEEYTGLVAAGVDVESHQGVPNQIHHKYAIIDQIQPLSDPMVITGSHNWSSSAETTNDENTVIVHDATFANIFYQEFMQRYNDLTGNGIDDNEATANNLIVYPNPSNGLMYLAYSISKRQDNMIRLIDLTGKTVLTKQVTSWTGENRFEIDASGIAAGIYHLQISGETFKVNRKVVISH